MKKLMCMIIAVVAVVMPTQVWAKTNEINVEMSEEEYNTYVEKFGEEFVDYMSQETYDNLKNGYKVVDIQEKYYKTIEYKTPFDEVLRTEEVEITKEEYDAKDPEISTQAACTISVGALYYDCWETDSKKLYLAIMQGSAPSVYYTVTNVSWKALPKVRSYDVMGARVENMYIHDGGVLQLIYYKRNSNSTTVDNISAVKKNDNGVGFVAKLPVATELNPTKPIVLGMAQYMTVYSQYAMYSSYQHATSDITFNQASDFTFASGGLGNVFVFGGSVVSALNGKFDGMQGVKWTK